jgi:hypothetical protein
MDALQARRRERGCVAGAYEDRNRCEVPRAAACHDSARSASAGNTAAARHAGPTPATMPTTTRIETATTAVTSEMCGRAPSGIAGMRMATFVSSHAAAMPRRAPASIMATASTRNPMNDVAAPRRHRDEREREASWISDRGALFPPLQIRGVRQTGRTEATESGEGCSV